MNFISKSLVLSCVFSLMASINVSAESRCDEDLLAIEAHIASQGALNFERHFISAVQSPISEQNDICSASCTYTFWRDQVKTRSGICDWQRGAWQSTLKLRVGS